MKKTKVLILLSAIVLGLAASSCHTKQSCPAYGKRMSTNRHRV